MEKTNRIISLILTLLMIVSVIPMGTISANAVTNSNSKLSYLPNYGDVGGTATKGPTNSNGVQVRLNQIVDELKTKFPNGVFTADGQRCYDETNYCDCSLYGIVNAKYPSLSSTIVSKSSNGWDCAAFAKLITVLMFGTCKDTNDTLSLGSAHSASSYNSLRMGDLIYTGHPHWMIYISHTDTTVTVLDANGYGDQKIGYYRTYNLSNSNFDGQLSTWQSPHWDEVNSKYASTVSSISVQSKPSKTVYTVGETFSSSGLSIKVSMSDGTSKTVTSGFTVSSPDMKTAGTKTITVTYEGKTTTFTITVNNPPATVSSIAVQSKPTKTTYTVGETFSSSGLSIKVIMSDGTSKTVTSGFAVSTPDMKIAGTKTVTVTYEGKTTTFPITVKPVDTNNPSIKIDAGKAACGQQIKIPVIVEKTDLSTLTIDITYDSSKLKIASISEISFDMYDTNTKTPGKIRITATDNTSIPAGTVAVLTFDVIATSSCSTNISVSVDEAYDANDNPVNLTVFNGTLEILKAVPGDVNGDGKVSAIDARIALQYNAGNKELTAEQKAAADVNGDGKVSAIDARWILQAVAGNRVL